MRHAVHLRRDEKTLQIDLDGMSCWEEWLLALYFIFPLKQIEPGIAIHLIFDFLFISFGHDADYTDAASIIYIY